MIKLVAIDMDGTLLNNEKKIMPKQKEAIKKAIDKGVEIVICTGRPKFGAMPLYESLELGNKNEYIILNNGCSIYKTKNMELIDYFELSKEEIKWLYSLKKDFNIDFTITTEEHFYFVAEEDEIPNERTVFDSKVVFCPLTKISVDEAIKSKEIVFKGMFTGEPEDINKFEASLTEDMKEKIAFIRSQSYIVEALPLNANKKTGLQKLLGKLEEKIEIKDIMTIGDENNDIEMLEFAGIGVAMGNAKQHIKDKADYVTDTNENDGVAKVIEKFILNK